VSLRSRIEANAPIPGPLPFGSRFGLPFENLRIGECLSVEVGSDWRAKLRHAIEQDVMAHSFATGELFLVRSCRDHRIRAWLLSRPSEFVPPGRIGGR
jgi:hypothetical protein